MRMMTSLEVVVVVEEEDSDSYMSALIMVGLSLFLWHCFFCMYTNKWYSWQNRCIYLIFQAQQLECEQGPLQRRIVELENCVSSLSQQLQQEQKHRQEENQLLARHLAERTQHIEVLVQQLEDQKGENQVLRRKQASALKVRIDVNISLWIIF